MGRTLSTTYDPSESTPRRVRIIRRHHPLVGEELVVLRGGTKRLVVRLPDDSPIMIPRDWTDADGEGGEPPSTRETLLTIDSLLRLMDLLDAMDGRS